MLNKKAQGMPMNVVIIAIIVLVVLVILIAFFAGGFGSIVGKVRDLFTGQTSGQAKDVVIQTCQNLCESAQNSPESVQKSSGYCQQTFIVDHDSDPNTKAKRMSCGGYPSTVSPETLAADQKRGLDSSQIDSIGVECPVSC